METSPHLVKRAKEVDPFDVSSLAVIVVPTDEFALVGIGLLLYGIVDNQDPRIFILALTHQRLDQAPQLRRVKLLFGEEAGDFVVAYRTTGHL